MLGALAAPALVPVAVSAADIQKGLECGSNLDLSDIDSCNADTGTSDTDLGGLLKNIVNILSIIVGVVAVIMIIIGGFRYITSGGESSNVSGAKNTLIYAIVGLVIVALAQFIVHFVLSQTANIG